MIVTEYFLELKDKYLQMENTLWVVDKIKKKKHPLLRHITEKPMDIKDLQKH